MGNLQARLRRRYWLKLFLMSVGMGSALLFLYLARQLLLPILAALVLAYLCKPLVYNLRRRGVPSSLSLLIVGGSLIGLLAVGLGLAYKALPQGVTKIETLIRAEHRINEVVGKLLKTDQDEPSWIYQKFGREVDTLMVRINGHIRISPAESEVLRSANKVDPSEKLKSYLSMVQANETRSQWQPLDVHVGEESMDGSKVTAQLTSMIGQLSIWVLMPIIFFFLLGDNGSIFKFFMRLIPNSYFELSLTIMERVDKALGHYLRGTALECGAVGAVISLGLFIFGINLQTAVLIGLISGVTNAIPFFGTFVGIASGLAYAMIAENVTPQLPFLTPDHLFLGVVITVLIAHFLDNAIFQPLLVGKAVNLHPVVVVCAVAAGGLGFGFIGLLFAMPAVVIAKTCLETLVRGLREYRLI